MKHVKSDDNQSSQPLCVSFQVLSVTSNSEYCEQFVAYACRMSRLLNTPGKVHLGLGLGGGGGGFCFCFLIFVSFI